MKIFASPIQKTLQWSLNEKDNLVKKWISLMKAVHYLLVSVL